MKQHKLEWYVTETNSYIYDQEVTKLLTPKLNESINTLSSIQELISEATKNVDTLPLTAKYQEYEELLSVIQTILETHFNSN